MTRTANATFHGTAPVDADVDVETFKRVLREIVQDLNRLYDLVTGENGIDPDEVINHRGKGRGSQLGFPSWNQIVNKRLHQDVALTDRDILVGARPLFVPANEPLHELRVRYEGVHGQAFSVQIYDVNGDLVLTEPLTTTAPAHNFDGFVTASFMLSPGLYFVHVRTRLVSTSDFTLRALTMPCGRPGASGGTPGTFVAEGGANFPVDLAAFGEALAWFDLHDELFASNYAVPGFVLTKLNRLINNLWEYALCAAVKGNNSLLNDDDGTDDPSVSRVFANTRSVFPNEGLVTLNVLGEAFGAIGADGELLHDATFASGISDWFAPYPVVTTADQTGRRTDVYLPDFPNDAESKLKCVVLAVNGDDGGGRVGWSGNWQARVKAGSKAATSYASFTQIGTSPFYYALIEDIDFDPDVNNALLLQTQNGVTSYAFGEFLVLGWAWFFDPDDMVVP